MVRESVAQTPYVLTALMEKNLEGTQHGPEHDALGESNGREEERTIGEQTDVEWSEYSFHNAQDAVSKSNGREGNNSLHSLFNENEGLDEFVQKYKGIPAINLQGESHCNWTKVLKSTGLAIWEGGDRLCQFLVEYPYLVKSKNVLELGSGTGLCSIASHLLGAKRVVATDGDYDALQNLKTNVRMNAASDDGVHVCQLIWGQNNGEFLRKFGYQDVILASDCLYMEKCVKLLWETIDELLITSEQGALTGNEGIVIYVNHCISQVSLEYVTDIATKQFAFEVIDHGSLFGGKFPDVHLLRRKKGR